MSRIDASPDAPGIALRRSLPALSLLFAILLMMVPLPLALPVTPSLTLLLLILWGRIQPQLLPPWLAFLIGLVADACFGQPFGVSATLYPLVVVAVRLADQRLEGNGLAIDWAFAALVLAVAHFLLFEFLVFAGLQPAILPIVAKAALSMLAYPLATAIVARMQIWLISA